jgi:propionyl-CoA carboxylase beta chain
MIFCQHLDEAKKIAARAHESKARFLSPFVAAECGYIDDIIVPQETRKRVTRALAMMLQNKSLQNPWKNYSDIPL